MSIAANEALAKLASVGLMPNMVLYLMGDYKMGAVKATKILFLWFAATNFSPVVAAFVADAYLGRFHAIGFGSILSFLVRISLFLSILYATSHNEHRFFVKR